MKKLVLIIALLSTTVAFAQTVDVTFKVDMNDYEGSFDVVYVNSTFNAWCGSCNAMADDDMDGIWEVTLPLEPDTIEYKFTVDGWTDQEGLTEGDACTTTNGGFTNRILAFDDDLTLDVVCWNYCVVCADVPELIDLPINWDDPEGNYAVTDFGGTNSSVEVDPVDDNNMVLQTIKTETAATWGGTTLSTPSGFANPIAFDSLNNIVSVKVYSPQANTVVRLKVEDHLDPTHSVETEATVVEANTWETLIFDFSNEAEGTAAINYDYTFDMMSIFYNFNIDGATAGELTFYCDDVTFGESGGGGDTYDVTFQVDMNDYVGDFTEIQLNGTFNGWCGDCNPMSDDDADGVWDVTIPLTEGDHEYKFTFDNWTGQENLASGSECTVTADGFTNRFLSLSSDTTLALVCWESCEECTGMPTNANVTFKVDMNAYTGDPYDMVNLNGVFNGWCGTCTEMTDDDADGVYEITILVSTGTIEYKFTLNGWDYQEEFAEGSPCTSTIDGFTNRTLTFEADTVLDVVCYNSCEACLIDNISENTISDLKIFPNPANDQVWIQGDIGNNSPYQIIISDVQGKRLYNQTFAGGEINQRINTESFVEGIYLVEIRTETTRVNSKLIINK